MPDAVPFGLTGAAGGTIRFTLYVSEAGEIDRIDTDAPAGLEYATRFLEQTIRASAIIPGTLGGAPARSRWALEFDLSPVAEGWPSGTAP